MQLENTSKQKYGYKVGRNKPCPCGSGKKYKYCCYEKDRYFSFKGVLSEELKEEKESK